MMVGFIVCIIVAFQLINVVANFPTTNSVEGFNAAKCYGARRSFYSYSSITLTQFDAVGSYDYLVPFQNKNGVNYSQAKVSISFFALHNELLMSHIALSKNTTTNTDATLIAGKMGVHMYEMSPVKDFMFYLEKSGNGYHLHSHNNIWHASKIGANGEIRFTLLP